MEGFFPSKPVLIAHRGAAGYGPENTLAAYRQAVSLGFVYAETDVRLTADNQWVCIHDERVDRTSDGSGTVATMTLEQLTALDFGTWFHPDFAGEPICLLADLLVLCQRTGLRLLVEIKDTTLSDLQLMTLLDLVHQYQVEKQVSFISFHWEHIGRIRHLHPHFWLGYLAWEMTDATLEGLLSSMERFFIDVQRFPDGEPLQLAKKAGIPVVAWTVNEREQLKVLREQGVHITTDSLLPVDFT